MLWRVPGCRTGRRLHAGGALVHIPPLGLPPSWCSALANVTACATASATMLPRDISVGWKLLLVVVHSKHCRNATASLQFASPWGLDPARACCALHSKVGVVCITVMYVSTSSAATHKALFQCTMLQLESNCGVGLHLYVATVVVQCFLAHVNQGCRPQVQYNKQKVSTLHFQMGWSTSAHARARACTTLPQMRSIVFF